MAYAPTRTTPRQPREAATWRGQLAALRYVPKFIQLMWQTHRGYTATMAGLRLWRAFIPVTVKPVSPLRAAPAYVRFVGCLVIPKNVMPRGTGGGAGRGGGSRRTRYRWPGVGPSAGR